MRAIRDLKAKKVTGIGRYLIDNSLRPENQQCRPKHKFSFNRALEVSTLMQEEYGDFMIEIYYCLWCFKFHIGHSATRKKRLSRHCVWCGQIIRPSRAEKHDAKCRKN